MICPECRDGEHFRCPEIARHDYAVVDLTPTELAGSAKCDCQHQARLGRPLTGSLLP